MPSRLFPELEAVEESQQTNQEVAALVAVFAAAQARIRRLLAQITTGSPQRWVFERLIRDINAEITLLNRKVGKWANEVIPLSYQIGWDSSAAVAAGYGLTKVHTFDKVLTLGDIHQIRDQVIDDLARAGESMKRSLGFYARQRQQQVSQEAASKEAVESGAIPAEVVATVTSQVSTATQAQVDTERYVSSGSRTFTPAYFAAMVAAAWSHQALVRGAVTASLEYGADLVQWAVRPGACPICLTHSGRVYSITGTTADFPTLVERPPRHLHCRCSLIPVTRALLAERGILAAMSRLSLSTPKFKSEKDAQEWLDQNPQFAIASIGQLETLAQSFI